MAMATAVERFPKQKRLCALFLATGISLPVHAVTGHLTPSLSIRETLTDNVDLSANHKVRDWISDVAPGLLFDGATARSKWTFDYQRHELIYGRDAARNNAQNLLTTSGTLEAVDKWLYVDGHGSVSQQTISAFGTQAPSNANTSDNRAETSTYQVSPYILGKLGSSADYQLRYNWTSSRSQSSALSNVRTGEWIGSVKGATALAALGWSADAASQKVNSANGSNSVAEHIRGSLSYQLDPQFRMSIIAGREANDYATLTKESTNTGGFGLDWVPSETTSVSATKEKRFFGDGHSFSFKHRTPLSAWEYTDRKDATVLPTQLANGSLGSIYDLLFFMNASKYPDPVERAQAVSQYLQAQGISPNAQVLSGFLSSNSYVERARQGSFALIGASNTLTFVASESDRHSLSKVSNVLGDFGNSSDILQRGFSSSWAHKLSALSSLTTTLAWTQSIGSGLVHQDSKQKALNVNFATQLSPKTTFSLGARHARFDSSMTSGYRENALVGEITVRF
jgi:uncharacterized protein (PEP-CTERM system associated)